MIAHEPLLTILLIQETESYHRPGGILETQGNVVGPFKDLWLPWSFQKGLFVEGLRYSYWWVAQNITQDDSYGSKQPSIRSPDGR